MTGVPVRFARNLSGMEDIRLHLAACSESFVPPLSTRVDLAAYAGKLAERAERFEAWGDGILVGLVALYCPPVGGAVPLPAKSDAFVSNVSVLPDYLRRGIGRHLLSEAIAYARGRAARIVLDVDRRAKALQLYRKSGFVIQTRQGDTLTLALPLADTRSV